MPDPVKLTEEQELDAAARQDFEIAPDAVAPGTKTPAAAPAPGAAAPAASAAPAADDWKLKAKFDHEEKDLDFLEWAKEQRAKGRLKEIVERDYGFDRRLARESQEARVARDREIIADLTARGYTLKPNPQNPSVLDIFPPSTAPVAMPSAAPADPLAKEIADLEGKIRKDATTPGVGADPEDLLKHNRLVAKLEAQQGTKTLEEKQAERERKAVEERAKADQSTKYQQAVAAVTKDINGWIDARAKSFEGPKWLRDDCTAKALELAKTPGTTQQHVEAFIASRAAELDAMRGAAGDARLAGAAPPKTPPVLSGVPAGGKGPVSDKDFDINNDEHMAAEFGITLPASRR